MYHTNNNRQMDIPNFYLPFSGTLEPNNRWIQLAKIVPWELAEEIYNETLCEQRGAPALSARIALGALLIKERQGLTDRETVECIQENPYLQYFIGLEEFTSRRPFDPSLMVDFRKRFGELGLARISEAIALASLNPKPSADESTTPNDNTPNEGQTAAQASDFAEADPPAPTDTVANASVADVDQAASANHGANRGKLILDATCSPADIRYPTDVSLLNEAREATEDIIDALHQPLIGFRPRPRTYREKARKKFTAFIRRKNPKSKTIRRAIREQLGYVRRNLEHIDRLVQTEGALPLPSLAVRLYKLLLVCHEVFRQQKHMYDERVRRIDDRIVSLTQPHVRPIKRGKAGRDTEFGAKLSVSVVEGFSFLDYLRWDNFNESCDLVSQVELYRDRFGVYPESVHVDQIYRTRENRAYCKQRGIRISGPPLGRRPSLVCVEQQKQAAADEALRSTVEGKFGVGKRRYGLSRVMAKRADTSAAQIGLSFLVMNLELALGRFLFVLFFSLTQLLVQLRRAVRLVHGAPAQ